MHDTTEESRAPMIAVNEEIVERIIDGFCTACLKDFSPSDDTVQCANCEAQLHATCNDCPCEKIRKENQTP